MKNDNFKVIITGRYQKGINLALAAEKIGNNSDITPTEAIKLIKAKKQKTLHKEIEHKKAYTLKRLLNEAGIEITLEPANISFAAKVSTTDKTVKKKRFQFKNLISFRKKKT